MRDAKPAGPDDDEYTGLENLHAIRRAWAQLVTTAQLWREHPGFNEARWRHIETNPVLAAQHRERTERSWAKYVARESGPVTP